MTPYQFQINQRIRQVLFRRSRPEILNTDKNFNSDSL